MPVCCERQCSVYWHVRKEVNRKKRDYDDVDGMQHEGEVMYMTSDEGDVRIHVYYISCIVLGDVA